MARVEERRGGRALEVVGAPEKFTISVPKFGRGTEEVEAKLLPRNVLKSECYDGIVGAEGYGIAAGSQSVHGSWLK